LFSVIVLCLAVAAPAQGGIRADLSGDAVVHFATTMDLPLMTVGNPGNAGEQSGLPPYDTDYYGGVDYAYNIGKFEVTAGQYTEFLNAVAATDTYGLYNTKMWLHTHGCKIKHIGTPGSYSYSVAGDRANRPVNYVSWGDAARFANWLQNGQPTGAQDLTTTEDGSYFVNGATYNSALQAVTRRADALYVIPNEDEWYKAAYHKNDGVTGNYFDYPTSSDAVPSNNLIDADPGNNATFRVDSDYTVGDPYWTTEVGEHENSESPYDTFDMGGNVWEWNEAILSQVFRGFRGGSFYVRDLGLLASYRYGLDPVHESYEIGFRVAEVPEPVTMSLLALGGLALLRRADRTTVTEKRSR